jgi:hypothetical protein
VYVADTTFGRSVLGAYHALTYLKVPPPLGTIAAVPHGPVIDALEAPVAVKTHSR